MINKNARDWWRRRGGGGLMDKWIHLAHFGLSESMSRHRLHCAPFSGFRVRSQGLDPAAGPQNKIRPN